MDRPILNTSFSFDLDPRRFCHHRRRLRRHHRLHHRRRRRPPTSSFTGTKSWRSAGWKADDRESIVSPSWRFFSSIRWAKRVESAAHS